MPTSPTDTPAEEPVPTDDELREAAVSFIRANQGSAAVLPDGTVIAYDKKGQRKGVFTFDGSGKCHVSNCVEPVPGGNS